MKQLEDVIDKDEYDRSNFEEKILKREESMNEDNHQIINEDPEVNPINQKLVIAILKIDLYGVQIL